MLRRYLSFSIRLQEVSHRRSQSSTNRLETVLEIYYELEDFAIDLIHDVDLNLLSRIMHNSYSYSSI